MYGMSPGLGDQIYQRVMMDGRLMMLPLRNLVKVHQGLLLFKLHHIDSYFNIVK